MKKYTVKINTNTSPVHKAAQEFAVENNDEGGFSASDFESGFYAKQSGKPEYLAVEDFKKNGGDELSIKAFKAGFNYND